MKKARTIIALLVAGIVIGALAAYFLLGPGPGQDKEKAAGSAVPDGTPFAAVTSQLDPGGTFYMFWDTAGLVQFCEKLLDGFESMLGNQPDDDATREKNLKRFRLVRRMIGETGLYRVRGLGVSSTPITDGMHRTRMVMHRDPEATSDLIWNLAAPRPHELGELQLLPADTVLAQFGDFRPRVLWDWIHAQAEKSDVAEFKKGVSMIAPALKMRGIDLEGLMDGFNGSAGLVVTLDRERTIPVPMGKQRMDIPAPGLAVVLAVRDFTLFDLMAANLPGGKDTKGQAVRSLTLPAPPSPLFPSPTLACNGNHLVIASVKELADNLMSANGGLQDSTEFKKLSRDMPAQGNGFRYVSPRLGEVVRSIQDQALKNPELKENDRRALKTFMSLIPGDFSMYGVMEHDATGFRHTLNHRLGLHHLVIMPAVMFGGMATAVAIPAMIKNVEANRCKTTLARMRTLSVNLAVQVTENGAAPETFTAGVDGWGNPILYRRGPGMTDYALASGGADGRFEGWDQKGFYTCGDPANRNRDMIMVNGELVYGPRD